MQPRAQRAKIKSGSVTYSQAATLELAASELSTVSAGTLQVGRLDSTGNLNLSGLVQSGDVNANTFRVVANNVTAAGSGGIGFNFAHNVEMLANNNLQPGSFT